MRVLASIFEGITVLSSLVGAFLLLSGFAVGVSAIQSASLAAMGVGFAAIPYCIAGVFHRAAVRQSLAKNALAE
jgi:hypothetical protein